MEELHLFIYGEIGGGFFEEGGPSSEEIQKQLTAHPEAEDVIVHISSPGGGVFDGWTIGNIIKNSGRNTTAKIEGLCASIATFIALSCDRVEMAETARFMIHNPVIGLDGEEEDLEAAAEQLAKIKDDLLKVYKKKTGLSIHQLSSMMDKETWFNAIEARAKNFVDDIIKPVKAVAKFDIKNKKMLKVEKPVEAKVDLSVLDKIIAKAKEVLNPTVKNVTVQLADGGAIFVESEDEELEGKAAFMVDEEGNPTETPVEDGTFTLDDGRSLTVEDGVVTSVQEEVAPEEVDVLKDQVKALEAQIKDSEEKEKKTEKEKEATDKTVSELILDVENLKKMTVGETGKLKKPIHEPVNKFNKNEPEAQHSLDAWAKSLKNIK